MCAEKRKRTSKDGRKRTIQSGKPIFGDAGVVATVTLIPISRKPMAAQSGQQRVIAKNRLPQVDTRPILQKQQIEKDRRVQESRGVDASLYQATGKKSHLPTAFFCPTIVDVSF